LPTVADPSADTHFEGGQHFGQRPTPGREHNAGAHKDRARPGGNGGLRGRLPFPADLGEKALAGGAVFIDRSARGIAVKIGA
jgi:hypothetical protein